MNPALVNGMTEFLLSLTYPVANCVGVEVKCPAGGFSVATVLPVRSEGLAKAHRGLFAIGEASEFAVHEGR